MDQIVRLGSQSHPTRLDGGDGAFRRAWTEDVRPSRFDLDPQARPTLLLITCHDLDEPLKSVCSWGSTVLDLEAQALIDILAVRWEIETFFEYDKDLLGSDPYQRMSAQAILRFWTLTACLMCCLEEPRTFAKPQLITCGEIRRKVQDQHRRNFLVCLKAQFQASMTIEQISSQLALCSS